MNRLKKVLLYVLYLVVVTVILLEISVRFLTAKNDQNIELVLGKNDRFLLPLPTVGFPEKSLNANKDSYRVYDDTLGWSHKPWGYDTSVYPLFANNLGMRIGGVDYVNKVEAKAHYKILTIGNSFTHGDAVAAENTWSFLLEEKMNVSVGNLGVGGYGIQQALMRLMTTNITADTVLFAVIFGDFERALEPVYSFYQGGAKTKPLIDFPSEANFEFFNVPVLKPAEFNALKADHSHPIFNRIPGYNNYVFSNSFWTKSYLLRLIISYQFHESYYSAKPIYLTDDKKLDYCIEVFKLFQDYCRDNGIYPKVVLLDNGRNYSHSNKWSIPNPWHLVEKKFKESNINYVEFHEEVFEAISEERSNVIHPIEKLHYSEKGNELIATLLFSELKQ